jgi:glycosyltransferase involved in cell wall biosynthesis
VPSVSVVMPVRNAERYVALAATSILGQTLDDLELIVVDDGCTDSSIERVRDVADSRVTFVEGPKRGLGAARNAGVRTSSGPWIAFIDADDLSAPTRISEQLAALSDQASRLDAVGCSPRIVDERGEVLSDAPYIQHPDAIASAAYSFMPMCGPSLMISRSELESVGCYSEDPQLHGVEDYDLLCRLLQAGGRVANLGGSLYLYRHHEASMTNARGDQMAEAALTVRNRYWSAAPPHLSFRQIAGSRAGDPRLHASAYGQLAIGCFRRKLWLSAAKIASATVISNPRGVLRLVAP